MELECFKEYSRSGFIPLRSAHGEDSSRGMYFFYSTCLEGEACAKARFSRIEILARCCKQLTFLLYRGSSL